MSDQIKAIWRGDDKILREGSEVVILAFDPTDPNVPARMACWVRHWPEHRDFPVYRSCDLSDLEVSDEDFERMQEGQDERT